MSNAQELAQYIRGIAPIPFSEVAEPVVAGSKRSTAAIEGVECVVDEVTRRQTLTFDEMVAFDPNADALWPGSVVQGKPLRDGYVGAVKKRATHRGATGKLTLSINTNNHRVGDGTLKVTVKVWRREQG